MYMENVSRGSSSMVMEEKSEIQDVCALGCCITRPRKAYVGSVFLGREHVVYERLR